MLVSYRAVLARPGARPLAFACGLGWLSFAAYGLAIVLAARAATGSFAGAGAVVAAFSAGSALLAPLRGRTVDRRGPRALIGFALAHVVAMVALVAGCALHGSTVALILAAALAGAAIPPLIGTARTVWPVVTGVDLARTGHALNATLGDVGQVAGPALVGALAAAISPVLALAFLIPGVAVGCALVARVAPGTPASPRLKRQRRPAVAPLRALLLAELLLGATFGALDVAAPIVAQRSGHAALAALPLAAFALGSVLASIWSGTHRARRPPRERYVRGCALLAAALALAPLLDALAPLTALLVLAGAGYGLLNVAVFELLPDEGGVEAFTWLTTSAGVGLALGAALAGAFASQALLVVAIPATAAALVALGQRSRRLTPMSRRDELEALSSQELHDRAVSRAKKHLDVKFLWNLMQMVPAAEAAAGEPDQADYDVAHWSGQVADTFREDDGKLSDALRPVYLDYLEQHADG